MVLRREKIDENSLRRLDDLEEWLGHLETDKQDRVHQAIAIVHEYQQKFLANVGRINTLNPLTVDAPRDARTTLYADLEVTEFLNIHDAFRCEPYDLIAPKVKRASSGPFMPTDELADNADARNIQFELALAAEWRLNGLRIRLDEQADFVVSAGATDFIVECKRPSREGSIRSNIRSAKRQLETRLENAQNLFGAVAVSVTKILIPPTHALMNRSALPSVQRDPASYVRAVAMESKHSPEARIQKWADDLRKEMNALATRVRWRSFDFHDRIIAIYFLAKPPFIHPKAGIGRMSVAMVAPVGTPGPAFTYLQDATNKGYGRNEVGHYP